MNTFEVKDTFVLNGEPIKLISGGMHYFRVVPEYWRDRLEKLKAMGCNTVETYVAWNVHEPKMGEFCFTGIADVGAFIRLAQELGLWVIVRPSPYICAEWEFGGLPAWLLKEDGVRLRGLYEPYMTYVKRYYKELFKILSPLQINHGGPVIMMQVENEYGYYGDDKNYLAAMRDLMRENGVVVPLVTSDGPWGDALESGKVDGVLPTANFGSNVASQFRVLAEHTDGGPLMCMEFWVGWFDNWGCGKHSTSDLSANIRDFDDAIDQGNVNIYMFHGGTNFGFMNGSNYYDELSPDVTSYDYDAVLSEGGDITPKYEAFQKIAAKYVALPQVTLSTKIEKIAYGKAECTGRVSLFATLDRLATPVENASTLSMEKLDQGYGYVLYRTHFAPNKYLEKIRFWGANDRANLFANGKALATYYDLELLKEHKLDFRTEEALTLDILVENMGRVNFGPNIERQRKGIDAGVQINGHYHLGWTHYALPMDNLDQIDWNGGYTEGQSAFYRFNFTVDRAGDTFLDMEGFGKGFAVINGFNLGRFWDKGPQKRLYVPAPLLREGENELIIFESEGKAQSYVTLADAPDLG